MAGRGSIALFIADDSTRERGRALAEELSIELLDGPPAAGELYLHLDHSGLAVRRSGFRQRPVRADFLAPTIAYRRRLAGRFKQPLARAVGVTGSMKPVVLDTTAGLGRDSFILASLGCQVTMLERSPIVGALLTDGLRRAAAEEEIQSIVARMQLFIEEAVEWIAHNRAQRFDVIYIDPMFPARRKSALVKGEMQILHDLVGVDEEVDPLLMTALAQENCRVVVKRPKSAGQSEAGDPDFILKGRSSRFDVYLTRSRPRAG